MTKITIKIDDDDNDSLVRFANNERAHGVVFDVAVRFRDIAVTLGFLDYDDDEFTLDQTQIYAVINEIINDNGYDRGIIE